MTGTSVLLLGGLSAIAFDFGPGSPVARLVPDVSARLIWGSTLEAVGSGLTRPGPGTSSAGTASASGADVGQSTGSWLSSALLRSSYVSKSITPASNSR